MLASFFPLFLHFSPIPSPLHPLAWRLPAANTIHLRHITTTSFSCCSTCYTPNGPRWMLTNCWTSFISLGSAVASVCLSLPLSLSLSSSFSLSLSLLPYLSVLVCLSVCLSILLSLSLPAFFSLFMLYSRASLSFFICKQ